MRDAPGPGARLPRWAPLLAVGSGTVAFGGLNVHDARVMAPNWGQDLAFFTQIAWSAAHGGPWSSPLLFEPQGLFAMVHTHLVLPLVVLLYAVVPRQETLLVAHSAAASLALWPAMSLGTASGGRLVGVLAAVGLAAFGPFQAAATADFRPSVLFLPGLLGVFAAAWEGRSRAMLGWAAVALAGRQEACYLLGVAGGALLLVPWNGWRWRQGLQLVGLALLSFGAWVLLKPEMFFHFDPLGQGAPFVPDAETSVARWDFLGRLARSGMILGALAPAGWVAAVPMAREMAGTWREWQRLVGPSAHYTAFWLPFVAASAIAGAGALARRLRRPALVGAFFVVLDALAFPWPAPRQGPAALRALTGAVRPEDRVAADYDTIHALAGRAVLWNVEQLYLPEAERPRAWAGSWPLTLDEVDVVVASAEHPLVARAAGWEVVATVDDHVVLRRP